LSSPGSTAHTVATPAIHDASTDTSPDNDASQFGDGKAEEERSREVSSQHEAILSSDANPNDVARQSPSDAVEAQLLQESAAVHTSETGHSDTFTSSVVKPAEGGDPNSTQSNDPRQGVAPAGSAPLSDSSQEPAISALTATHTKQSGSSAKDLMDVDPVAEPRSLHLDKASTLVSPIEERLSIPHEGRPTAAILASPREVERHTAVPVDRSAETSRHSGPLPTPAEQNEPQSSQMHAYIEKTRARSMKKVPRVVFGRPQNRKAELVAATDSEKPDSYMLQDYFSPLFVQGFASQSKSMKTIEQLAQHAYKTVSTSDLQTTLLESQACKILKRIYFLQQQDKWSLRQPKRSAEPGRPSSHWDAVLHEMKWMRTDFREERKWKRTAARNMALECARWVAADVEERKTMQVSAVIPVKGCVTGDELEITIGKAEAAAVTLSMVSAPPAAARESESADTILPNTVAPSAIFTLQDNDVVFSLHESATATRLLDELPIYGSPLKGPPHEVATQESDADAWWQRPAVPISKYIEGQVSLKTTAAPRWGSRFHYEEEEDDEDERVVFGAESEHAAPLERLNRDVALFNPEMKVIRDRLYVGHQFRPPVEFPMPSQAFFENRSGSQWLWVEDDQLKSLVREHSYNWGLISELVSSKSLFSSGAERRTPWECFERWVHLEGLPNDMSKTAYFKTYHNRIDAAQRVIQELNQKMMQANPSGSLPVQRRRPTTTVRVERRRNSKHLAMIDAMRKLAKKREAQAAKQQYSANMQAGRKAEQPQQRPPTNHLKTPREYSLMRWERDQQLAEKMAQFAQRTEMQRRVRYFRPWLLRHPANFYAGNDEPFARSGSRLSQWNGHCSSAGRGANGSESSCQRNSCQCSEPVGRPCPEHIESANAGFPKCSGRRAGQHEEWFGASSAASQRDAAGAVTSHAGRPPAAHAAERERSARYEHGSAG
jgi:chromatin modification-related protein VID21